LLPGGAPSGLVVSLGSVTIGSLVNCATIETDASGNLSCGSGGGGLWTDGGDTTYLTATGDDVAIGVTSAERKLHAAGEILSTGSTAGFNFRDRGEGATDGWAWYSNSNIARFWREGTGDLIGITTSGNVGIGTTSPGYKLDVTSTIRVRDFGGAGTKNIIVGDDTFLSDIDVANFLGIYGNQNNDRAGIRLGSDGSYIFGDGGNIGIGTTSPVGKLEVSYLAGQAGINSTGSTGNTHLPWTNGWNYISGNGIIFRNTANGENMRYVASTGRLGIGTTGPSQKLDVIGNVRASRYYDDNTAFYIDSNITSQVNSIRAIGGLYINNTGPTLYLQDTNNRSA